MQNERPRLDPLGGYLLSSLRLVGCPPVPGQTDKAQAARRAVRHTICEVVVGRHPHYEFLRAADVQPPPPWSPTWIAADGTGRRSSAG